MHRSYLKAEQWTPVRDTVDVQTGYVLGRSVGAEPAQPQSASRRPSSTVARSTRRDPASAPHHCRRRQPPTRPADDDAESEDNSGCGGDGVVWRGPRH